MPSTHPSPADLCAFLLGKLPDAASDAVESHLSECPDCLDRAAAETPSDTLVNLLTAALTRFDHNGPAPADLSTPIGATFTRTFADTGPVVQAVAVSPPPELANHPKYRILRPLGFGGMGVVWLAEHLVMGRLVALKVMRAESAVKPAAGERFRREVRAVAKLTHENIAAAYDAEQVGDRHVLVMEYVPGEVLSDVVRRGPLPADEACRVVRDAARGLSHAHAAGLVHRDVKPGNLIRTPDGVTKVLDFGLVTAADTDAVLTGSNLVMGTPDYIAPEQAENPHAADARSDVYALGCTLYHLLSGRVPHPADSVLRKVNAHRDPAILPAPLVGVPAELSVVVAKMMAKDPAERYRTAAEVAAAVEPFTSAECGVRSVEPKTQSSIPHSAFRTPHWIAAGLLFAFVGLALAGVVVHRIQTDKGELVIETTDDEVEVVVKQGGKVVTIYDPKSKQKLVLQSGTYEFELNGKPTGLKLDIDKATFKRGDTVVAKIERAVKSQPTEKPVTPVAATPEKLQPYRTLVGHTKTTRQVVFSADAKTVYSCSDDEYVRVWDVESVKETAKFDHKNRVMSIALAEDGKTLLSATDPPDAKHPAARLWAWDLATGKEAAAFPPLPKGERLAILQISPDGKRLATGALSGTVQVWDVTNRKLERGWNATEGGNVYGVSWSPNGERIAVVGGHPLAIWEVASGKLIHRDKENFGDTSTTFSTDGKCLFAAGWGGLVRVYNATNWKLERTLRTKESRGSAATGLSSLPTGRLLLGAHAADVRVWDEAADRLVTRLTGEGLDSINPIASADGKWVACGSEDGKVRVWKLPESLVGTKLPKLPAVEELHRIPFVYAGWHDFSADGKEFMAYTSKDGKRQAVFFDTATGKETGRFPAPVGGGVWFIPGSQDVLVSAEGKFGRWDRATGKKRDDLFTMPQANEDGTYLMPLVDGKTVCVATYGAFGPRQHGVFVYDLTTGKERFNVKPLAKDTILGMSPRLSADGKRLATTDTTHTSSTIRIWDTATGEVTTMIDVTGALSAAVEFSPDGKEVVAVYAVGGDAVFGRWEVASGERVGKPVLAPAEPGGSNFFFPGGGWQGIHPPGARSLRYYDTRSGEVAGVYEAGDKVLSSVASADGRFALYVTDGSLRVVRNPKPNAK